VDLDVVRGFGIPRLWGVSLLQICALDTAMCAFPDA